MLQQGVPERRQRVSRRVTIEELRNQALFETAYAAPYGRVIRAKAACGSRQCSFPRDREKES